MADTSEFPTEICVLGQKSTLEWVLSVSRLNASSVKVYHCPSQSVNWTYDWNRLAEMIEGFYSFSFGEIVFALRGYTNCRTLDKIVILDDSFFADTEPSIIQKLRRRKRKGLLFRQWRVVPALLELMPTTFVAVTTNPDQAYHKKLTEGGVDLIFNPISEQASQLKVRLLARRKGIEHETDYAATRNQINLIWNIVFLAIFAPLLLEVIKGGLIALSRLFSIDSVTALLVLWILLNLFVLIPLAPALTLALIRRRQVQPQDQTNPAETLFLVSARTE